MSVRSRASRSARAVIASVSESAFSSSVLRNNITKISTNGSFLYQKREHRDNGTKNFFSTSNRRNQQQDVVIIGGGPGGYVGAIKAAQLGMKVTCVEKRPTLGGTCLNVGCIPSKALLNASHKFEDAKHGMEKHGISVGDVTIDVSKMMAQKMKSVTGLTKGIEGLFKKNGVTHVIGFGSLIDKNTVEVTKDDGSKETISTKNIVLATGSEPASLPGVEVDEKTIVTSTGALELEKVPETMVVIGGGVIGLELGSVWSRLGSKVTVVEFANVIGGNMDNQIRTTFNRALKKQKIDFKMETAVKSAMKMPDGKVELTVEKVGTKEQSKIIADVVLVSTGRKPYTKNLGLEKLGIKTDKVGRVEVNIKEHTWETNVPGIYAIGDIISGPMLAHKAEEEAIAVIEHLSGKEGHVNYDTIPSIIYTHPEVAWVGKTEEEVKAAGWEYNVGTFPFAANSRARTNDDSEGMVKFISCKKTDKIFGAHIVGPSAGELLSECVLAMEYGGSTEDIARTCHGHPTLSEAVKEAALATVGKAIHF